MNQPIVPEHEILNNALEINNYLLSAAVENQNLARFSDAVAYLEAVSKNLSYLEKVGEKVIPQAGVPSQATV